MPKIAYQHLDLSPRVLAVIAQANEIFDTYVAQGYKLTLRQLYYQFVSRDLIPNAQKEYKRLGDIVANGRLAGLIDWNHIEDRTRNLQSLTWWGSPESIVAACAAQYREDLWQSQPRRVEVWIEKDALIGVIERPCNRLRVPYFSCRGYTSISEVWGAAQRIVGHARSGQATTIFHLGDHDPSGIDMTRDIEDRLTMFCRRHAVEAPTVKRLALHMSQVEQYNPPPNPAKTTDSRYQGYQAEFGDESWELDALEPSVIEALIVDAVNAAKVDGDSWDFAVKSEKRQKQTLQAVSDRWDEVAATVYEPGSENDEEEDDDDEEEDANDDDADDE